MGSPPPNNTNPPLVSSIPVRTQTHRQLNNRQTVLVNSIKTYRIGPHSASWHYTSRLIRTGHCTSSPCALLDDDDVDPARVGVVAAEKGDEEARGIRDGYTGRVDAECFVGSGGDDGLGLGCVDVEALGRRGADVVVVIRGQGF
jgi:hypothetical protein